MSHATPMEKKWTDLSEMRKNEVEIVSSSKVTARKPFLRIKGEIGNVEHVAEKIQELQHAVKEHQIQVSRPGTLYKGETVNVECTVEKIQKLQCSVKESQIQISHPRICQ